MHPYSYGLWRGKGEKMSLMKNWRILLLVVALLFICVVVFVNFGHDDKGYLEGTNVKLGLDFEGGTLYQIELQEAVSVEEINRIAVIISQRVDPSGLKDASITPIGNQFIVIQISETNPAELEKIESRIKLKRRNRFHWRPNQKGS